MGLILSAWGGTPAESWMSRETLESDADFRAILEGWDETVAGYPRALEAHQARLADWEARKKEAERAGRAARDRVSRDREASRDCEAPNSRLTVGPWLRPPELLPGTAKPRCNPDRPPRRFDP